MMVMILWILLIASSQVESKFKSLHCESYDHSHGEFSLCKIKAINRYRNSISTTYLNKEFVPNRVTARLEFFKRANGWRPFLYNITLNVCDFLDRKKTKPNSNTMTIFRIAASYLMPYFNTSFTCPFQPNTEYKIENLEFDVEKFRIRFPIETGEYALNFESTEINKFKNVQHP
ncbi:uncharacterized protein LOC111081139 isoform X2 [Drosophila obscura]|uniref:uncharacterized protein LOC111081139 isoform X2 n=1 Tax=Drosophila obscura TaxID=7282 RepID=UPI000BA05F0D|nr:uncharacterized protein LOC111081139 isoform X2 [Drosophila obscura]